MRTVLVANRGEIARRVFRTARTHGLRTVAVYSEADADAVHVRDADEAVCIGPAAASASYLNGERVLEAARQTSADAIHPGYGFLSENAGFAEACERADITFIGPRPYAMRVMGDKVASRRAMVAAGVPVVPGQDDLASVSDAQAAALAIGFPLMLKASAGGGGKGMRIVHHAEALPAAFEAAAREAQAAFGDARLFVERAVLHARHVEIQVLADAHGNVVHLGERDCSVQRRHQKVVEESPCPSPWMTPRVRAEMGEVAVQAARAVQYVGAGTVEFLFEETPDGPKYYFLEMNTRLQVEHPVTEAVTGRDLVWDQIRVAQGEPLGFSQADVTLKGHAIECRIYAEDPVSFLPRPGTMTLVRWPANIRVDAAVESGSVVSSHYDPMIAKLIAHGTTRDDALATMREALDALVLLGTTTNVPLHHALFRHPTFASGACTTRFLDDGGLRVSLEPQAEHAGALAAAAAFQAAGAMRSTPRGHAS